MPKANKKGVKKFQRLAPQLSYKKVFFIFPEGETEKQYFRCVGHFFKEHLTDKKITLKPQNPKTKNTPQQMLTRAKIEFKKLNKIQADKTEMWLAFDVDNGKREAELKSVFAFCNKKSNYALAISNPDFEYWLLLHFMDGNKIKNRAECLAELKKHLPHYEKPNIEKFFKLKLKDNLAQAINHAKAKHKQVQNKYTDTYTTVHRLVEKLNLF